MHIFPLLSQEHCSLSVHGRDGGGEVAFRNLRTVDDADLFNDGSVATRDAWNLEEFKLPRWDDGDKDDDGGDDDDDDDDEEEEEEEE